MHDRLGRVPDHRAGPGLADPDAELGLLAARRQRADPADAVVEAAEVGEDLAPERHVGADHVADRALAGVAFVGAADDPVELRREPRGSARVPPRHHASADRDHVGTVVGLEQPVEPVVLRDRVVVEEGDDLAASRPRCRCCARPRGHGLRCSRRPAPRGTTSRHAHREVGRVVDDDDELVTLTQLGQNRAERAADVVPAVLGVAAHHDRDTAAHGSLRGSPSFSHLEVGLVAERRRVRPRAREAVDEHRLRCAGAQVMREPLREDRTQHCARRPESCAGC